MKFKAFAFIATAALAGTLFAETTVEGIGVGSGGFFVEKMILGSGSIGQFPEGFAISGIDDVTNAVALGYVFYGTAAFDDADGLGGRFIDAVAGYNAARSGRFNLDGYDAQTYQTDPLAPICGYPRGRWEHTSSPYYHFTGTIDVPSAGTWTLDAGAQGDSMVRIEIKGNGLEYSNECKYVNGEDMFCVVDFPVAGEYAVEIWQYAVSGDIYFELSAAKGEYASFDASAFNIVGDALTSYYVTFDAADGSFVEPQTVKAGRAVKKPADPFLDGYAFIGWTLNGAAYDFSLPVTSDITLLATWTDNVSPEIVSVSSSPTKPVIDGTSVEVALNVSAYDADNDALTYAWSIVGEAPAAYSFANADSASATVTINGPGTFTFSVSVSDGTATVAETVEVVVRISPNATAFEYVGCEYASMAIGKDGATQDADLASYPWGAANRGGAKVAWRSMSAGNNNEDAPVVGRKDLLLDEKRDNAYGLDGYVFPGTCGNSDGTTSDNVTSGIAYNGGLLVSNVTDFISSVEFVNGACTGPVTYWLDDPREDVSEDVKDFRPGIFSVDGCKMDSYKTFLRVRFGRHVRNHPTVRIGFLSGYNMGFKPDYISVGSTAHQWRDNGNDDYGLLAWIFFDVKNAKPGDVVECAIKGTGFTGNESGTCFIEGIVFDSIEKKTGFTVRIR